jgi:uncharacterized protein
VAEHSGRTPVLPAGAQVVLRQAIDGRDGSTAQRGATGRVAAVDADGRYLVRLADEREVRCNRSHTIYAAVVGSRAFGLDTDASDADTRGTMWPRRLASGHW